MDTKTVEPTHGNPSAIYVKSASVRTGQARPIHRRPDADAGGGAADRCDTVGRLPLQGAKKPALRQLARMSSCGCPNWT